ncbi:MAG: 3-phosphoshikimate 1-carboxyvinyltransferase, partial [Actinomycetota bacterium]
LRDWPQESFQPATEVLEVLGAFGARVTRDPAGLIVEGPSESEGIRGIDVDLSAIGETAPTMAAIAVFARSASTLRGIGHIRGHETDRLAALETEITGLGGSITQTSDGLRIEPSTLHAGTFHTYDDHRMATTAAIIGARVGGIDVENIDTTAKTLPDFANLWSAVIT